MTVAMAQAYLNSMQRPLNWRRRPISDPQMAALLRRALPDLPPAEANRCRQAINQLEGKPKTPLEGHPRDETFRSSLFSAGFPHYRIPPSLFPSLFGKAPVDLTSSDWDTAFPESRTVLPKTPQELGQVMVYWIDDLQEGERSTWRGSTQGRFPKTPPSGSLPSINLEHRLREFCRMVQNALEPWIPHFGPILEKFAQDRGVERWLFPRLQERIGREEGLWWYFYQPRDWARATAERLIAPLEKKIKQILQRLAMRLFSKEGVQDFVDHIARNELAPFVEKIISALRMEIRKQLLLRLPSPKNSTLQDILRYQQIDLGEAPLPFLYTIEKTSPTTYRFTLSSPDGFLVENTTYFSLSWDVTKEHLSKEFWIAFFSWQQSTQGTKEHLPALFSHLPSPASPNSPPFFGENSPSSMFSLYHHTYFPSVPPLRLQVHLLAQAFSEYNKTCSIPPWIWDVASNLLEELEEAEHLEDKAPLIATCSVILSVTGKGKNFQEKVEDLYRTIVQIPQKDLAALFPYLRGVFGEDILPFLQTLQTPFFSPPPPRPSWRGTLFDKVDALLWILFGVHLLDFRNRWVLSKLRVSLFFLKALALFLFPWTRIVWILGQLVYWTLDTPDRRRVWTQRCTRWWLGEEKFTYLQNTVQVARALLFRPSSAALPRTFPPIPPSSWKREELPLSQEAPPPILETNPSIWIAQTPEDTSDKLLQRSHIEKHDIPSLLQTLDYLAITAPSSPKAYLAALHGYRLLISHLSPSKEYDLYEKLLVEFPLDPHLPQKYQEILPNIRRHKETLDAAWSLHSPFTTLQASCQPLAKALSSLQKMKPPPAPRPALSTESRLNALQEGSTRRQEWIATLSFPPSLCLSRALSFFSTQIPSLEEPELQHLLRTTLCHPEHLCFATPPQKNSLVHFFQQALSHWKDTKTEEFLYRWMLYTYAIASIDLPPLPEKTLALCPYELLDFEIPDDVFPHFCCRLLREKAFTELSRWEPKLRNLLQSNLRHVVLDTTLEEEERRSFSWGGTYPWFFAPLEDGRTIFCNVQTGERHAETTRIVATLHPLLQNIFTLDTLLVRPISPTVYAIDVIRNSTEEFPEPFLNLFAKVQDGKVQIFVDRNGRKYFVAKDDSGNAIWIEEKPSNGPATILRYDRNGKLLSEILAWVDRQNFQTFPLPRKEEDPWCFTFPELLPFLRIFPPSSIKIQVDSQGNLLSFSTPSHRFVLQEGKFWWNNHYLDPDQTSPFPIPPRSIFLRDGENRRYVLLGPEQIVSSCIATLIEEKKHLDLPESIENLVGHLFSHCSQTLVTLSPLLCEIDETGQLQPQDLLGKVFLYLQGLAKKDLGQIYTATTSILQTLRQERVSSDVALLLPLLCTIPSSDPVHLTCALQLATSFFVQKQLYETPNNKELLGVWIFATQLLFKKYLEKKVHKNPHLLSLWTEEEQSILLSHLLSAIESFLPPVVSSSAPMLLFPILTTRLQTLQESSFSITASFVVQSVLLPERQKGSPPDRKSLIQAILKERTPLPDLALSDSYDTRISETLPDPSSITKENWKEWILSIYQKCSEVNSTYKVAYLLGREDLPEACRNWAWICWCLQQGENPEEFPPVEILQIHFQNPTNATRASLETLFQSAFQKTHIFSWAFFQAVPLLAKKALLPAIANQFTKYMGIATTVRDRRAIAAREEELPEADPLGLSLPEPLQEVALQLSLEEAKRRLQAPPPNPRWEPPPLLYRKLCEGTPFPEREGFLEYLVLRVRATRPLGDDRTLPWEDLVQSPRAILYLLWELSHPPLWKEQASLVEASLAAERNSFFPAPTGSGKSSTILPICLAATPRSVLVVPDPLLPTYLPYLSSTLARTFGIPLSRLVLSRKDPLTAASCRSLLALLERGPCLTTLMTIQTLWLFYLEIQESDPETVEILNQIFDYFRSTTLFVDEVHTVLSPTIHLQHPFGPPSQLSPKEIDLLLQVCSRVPQEAWEGTLSQEKCAEFLQRLVSTFPSEYHSYFLQENTPPPPDFPPDSYLLRGLFLYLLPYAWTHPLFVSHGPREGSLFAVPYLGNNTPDPKATFENPYVTAVLSAAMILARPLAKEQMALWIESYQKKAAPYLEKKRIPPDQTPPGRAFFALTGIPLSQATPHIPSTPAIQIDYLRRIVLPGISYYKENLQATFQTPPILFGHLLGFSATPLPSTAAPLQTTVPEDPTVVDNFLQLLRRKNPRIVRQTLPDASCAIVIDSGAHLRGIDNLSVAKRLYDPAYRGVLYFAKDSLYLWNGTLSTPYKGGSLEQTQVYLDHRHSQGTDLPFPQNAHAHITLSPRSTLGELLQAVGRLRQFSLDQSCTLVLDPNWEKSPESLEPLLAHLQNQEILSQQRLHAQALLQQLQTLAQHRDPRTALKVSPHDPKILYEKPPIPLPEQVTFVLNTLPTPPDGVALPELPRIDPSKLPRFAPIHIGATQVEQHQEQQQQREQHLQNPPPREPLTEHFEEPTLQLPLKRSPSRWGWQRAENETRYLFEYTGTRHPPPDRMRCTARAWGAIRTASRFALRATHTPTSSQRIPTHTLLLQQTPGGITSTLLSPEDEAFVLRKPGVCLFDFSTMEFLTNSPENLLQDRNLVQDLFFWRFFFGFADFPEKFSQQFSDIGGEWIQEYGKDQVRAWFMEYHQARGLSSFECSDLETLLAN